MRTLITAVSLLFLIPCQLRSQEPVDESKLVKSAVRELKRFANFAKRKKVGPRARRAYELVREYDDNDSQANRALGYKRMKGVWVEPPRDARKEWVDAADDVTRFAVSGEWRATSVKLAGLHRDLGLQLVARENFVRGAWHLEKAVTYDPLDVAAHQALEHSEYEGFWGTPDEIQFVKNFKELEKTALELGRKKYELQPIPEGEFPEELVNSRLEFKGAKSEHFKVFTRGSQENADDCVLWCERALELLEKMMGKKAKLLGVVECQQTLDYIVFVWTDRERKQFLDKNPKLLERIEGGKEAARRFFNLKWSGGRPGTYWELSVQLTPAQMHDRLIVLVGWHVFGAANDALAEGVYHASTWLLKSTCITKHGALPEGTQGDEELELPEGANWWLRAVRDQATAGTDWALNQVPREQLSRFRNDVRLKSWNFMLWCMARYPEQWYLFVFATPADKIPFPEEIEEVGQRIFEKPLAEVEAEWRKWASGQSGVSVATGYGPPILPLQPNEAELAGLVRINAIRALAELPHCELDGEASLACREHLVFLDKNPDHLKWPEAHEEDPAKEGFTPRGMRAGMRSVIAWSMGGDAVGFARDSIDLWIGTVYHRFPLLEPNIRRFGYALLDGREAVFTVLDMGSLKEPYVPKEAQKWLEWPVDGMVEVPRQFHGIEHPNPLGDLDPGDQDMTATGYPVSLQFSRPTAKSLSVAAIELYEFKARAEDDRGERVPLWVHTPKEPLLKRMDLQDVVFAIPRDHLKPNTKYLVEVHLEFVTGAERNPRWVFTTGPQMQGLGKRLRAEDPLDAMNDKDPEDG